jgi:hypothetical protein
LNIPAKAKSNGTENQNLTMGLFKDLKLAIPMRVDLSAEEVSAVRMVMVMTKEHWAGVALKYDRNNPRSVVESWQYISKELERAGEGSLRLIINKLDAANLLQLCAFAGEIFCKSVKETIPAEQQFRVLGLIEPVRTFGNYLQRRLRESL